MPCTAQTMASPVPVLPEVSSTTVPPGSTVPSRSACANRLGAAARTREHDTTATPHATRRPILRIHAPPQESDSDCGAACLIYDLLCDAIFLRVPVPGRHRRRRARPRRNQCHLGEVDGRRNLHAASYTSALPTSR